MSAIDELRAMAESVGLEIPKVATLMMEAADIIDRLDTENAQLRELVRDLWPFVKDSLVHACPNRECCLFEECNADFEYECPIEEYIAGRMRELGVERWADDS